MVDEWRPSVWDDLRDLPREAWDRLRHPTFYLTYDWLVARSLTIGGAPRFVLVRDGGERPLLALPCYVVSSASYQAYDPVALLLRAGDQQVRRAADLADLQAIRRLGAALEQAHRDLLPAVVVAAPGRSGGISYAEDVTGAQAVGPVGTAVAVVEGMAAETGAPLVAWLYLAEGRDPVLHRLLTARGYLPVVMDAENYLPIRWKSFEEYLQHFKSHYRKTIRREVSRFACAGIEVELAAADALGLELARLEVQWRAKYGRWLPVGDIVRQHDLIKETVGTPVRVFVARQGGRAIGFTVFFEFDGAWYSRFGGFDYGVGKLYVYYNLLFYAPVAEAIRRGITSIRYSTGAHDTKRSRGCLLANLLMYVRFPTALAGELGPGLRALDRLQRRRFQRIATSHTKQPPPS
jgi:predicted N-acyltransferase